MHHDDWDAEAGDSANLLQRDCAECDRGAFHTGVGGVCAAFATDDYSTTRRCPRCWAGC
jgi:hypothetical protein